MKLSNVHLNAAKIFSIFCVVCFFYLSMLPQKSMAFERMGRLGIGMSKQLKTDFPALSMKMQKSRSMSIGGLLGLSTDKTQGGYGAGVKIYRNIFDEPQLNFYFATTAALLSQKIQSTSYSGFQIDLTFGSEFHFMGLNSLGFSFEFGISGSKTQNFSLSTAGDSFIVSGVHFYL